MRDLAVVGLKSQHTCTSSLACIGFCSLVHPPALCCCFQLGMCITHCLLNWIQGLQEFVNSTSTSLLQLVCMHKFQTSLQHLALVQTLFALGPSLHYWGLYLVAPSLHPCNPPSRSIQSMVRPLQATTNQPPPGHLEPTPNQPNKHR